jgi:demethylmenaquinone methyltransferase/2-methoxy-6-polyprenyl-1,4-benzoquinol methylase
MNDLAQRVHAFFSHIAPSYDRANALLSFGIDRYWRYRLVRAVAACQPSRILDIATGSGDVALALARALPRADIVGLDFCQPMLEQARAKAGREGTRLRFVCGDAHALPMAAGSLEGITMAFGLRNLAQRSSCLAECLRVLQPGARLWILEFSQPYKALAPVYGWYLRHILPRLASLTTAHTDAYHYLADSIEAFPQADQLCEELRQAGFGQVRCTRLSGGIVALHEGRKPGFKGASTSSLPPV